jgi:hypothetical protein
LPFNEKPQGSGKVFVPQMLNGGPELLTPYQVYCCIDVGLEGAHLCQGLPATL